MTRQERRLRELRASDTIGLYAKDGPTTGRDPEENLSVTIDATNDVASVVVGDLPDSLRSTAAIQRAVDLAHRTAVAHKLAEAPAPAATRGARPPRRAVAQVERRTLPPLTDRRPPTAAGVTSLERPERRPVRDLDAVGTSRNDCVTVQLRPGLPTGTVAIDPTWLRRATPTTLSNAITEAFAAAYQERDRT